MSTRIAEVEPEKLVRCGRDLAGTDRPLDDAARAAWCDRLAGLPARGFLGLREGRVVAQALAAAPPGLRWDGARCGCLALLDVEQAPEVVAAATRWLTQEQQMPRVLAPFDLDVWTGYRALLRGHDRSPFLGEPRTDPGLPGVLEAAGFRRARTWHSFELDRAALGELRTALDAVPEPRIQGLDELGPGGPARLLDLLQASFASFPAFSPLPAARQQDLLRRIAPALHAHASFVAADAGGRDAVFALVLVDPLAAERGERRLILHSAGVAPGAQRQGLGRACFRPLLDRLLDDGAPTTILALVAQDGPVRRLFGRCAERPAREYALYALEAAR
jgi:GNAT superfamily N-acetyltransferase